MVLLIKPQIIYWIKLRLLIELDFILSTKSITNESHDDVVHTSR